MFQISNLFLAADFSAEVANNSAVGMLGSFIAAALLIVIPATAFLIFVVRKILSIVLLLEDASFCRSFKYTIYIGDLSNPLKYNFLEKECGQC